MTLTPEDNQPELPAQTKFAAFPTEDDEDKKPGACRLEDDVDMKSKANMMEASILRKDIGMSKEIDNTIPRKFTLEEAIENAKRKSESECLSQQEQLRLYQKREIEKAKNRAKIEGDWILANGGYMLQPTFMRYWRNPSNPWYLKLRNQQYQWLLNKWATHQVISPNLEDWHVMFYGQLREKRWFEVVKDRRKENLIQKRLKKFDPASLAKKENTLGETSKDDEDKKPAARHSK
ncbi:MAG: hypothetical protein HC836_41040 [Richelia sp. RM2_1_2]|nr:hypothetical protein [Richelia sp. RM2_1_2]